MAKTNHTFIVSDESVNSYGFRILTAGINTEHFIKNPVMFYIHERKSGIIGRWENIRIEDGKLLADAVFDESDPVGKRVKEQVESGFLRSASIGIENPVKEAVNGIDTVTRCELKEISIVDMPSNMNAVKLYRKSGKVVYRLSDLEEPEDTDLLQEIIKLLGLSTQATNTDVLEAISKLQQQTTNVEQQVDEAIQCGYINASQRSNFIAMATSNSLAFDSFVELRKQELNADIDKVIDQAIGEGKFISQDRNVYQFIGDKLGVPVLKKLLGTLHNALKPLDIIRSGSDRSSWTLNDYRKFAPLELKDNPGLYERLIRKEGGDTQQEYSLDYYRRNNPQYLKDNPQVYERLLRGNQSQF